jgi:hypothetical protein
MKVSLAGLDFSYSVGQEVDIDDKTAKQWIAVDYAQQVLSTASKKAKEEA